MEPNGTFSTPPLLFRSLHNPRPDHHLHHGTAAPAGTNCSMHHFAPLCTLFDPPSNRAFHALNPVATTTWIMHHPAQIHLTCCTIARRHCPRERPTLTPEPPA